MLSPEICESPELVETPVEQVAEFPLSAAELAPPDVERHPDAPANPARRWWYCSRRRLLTLAAIVVGLRIFVGEASVVPTASMEGTILVGDHLFMDKFLYGPEIPIVHWRLPMIKSIKRGDIVVFRYPRDTRKSFIKRVIGLPGDHIHISYGHVYVNGEQVLKDGEHTGAKPGRVVRGPGYKS